MKAELVIENRNEILEKINLSIECNEKYKSSYFFKPAFNSHGRRRNELNFNLKYENYNFIYNSDTYEVKYKYEESCKNVYFKLSIYKNDIKVNITALKKIANFDIKKDRKEKLLKLKSVK